MKSPTRTATGPAATLRILLIGVAMTISADALAQSAPSATPPAATTEPPTTSFLRDVAPILESQCKACHGPKTAESNYRLDTFAGLMTPGDYELAPVTAGDPDDSELLRLIESDDEDERMPNNGDQLTAEQIAVIRTWIEEGAKFDGTATQEPTAEQIPRLRHPDPPARYASPVPVTAVAFAPDGKRLLAAGYHELTVWNPETGELVDRIGDMPQRIYAIRYSPDGNAIAIAGGAPGVAGEARIISAAPAHDVTFHAAEQQLVLDIAMRPDGGQVAYSGADGSVQLYDLATGELQKKLEYHGDWVTGVAYSGNGEQLVTASRDKTSKVINVASGELVTTYSGHGQPVHAVLFAPDGKQVISAGDDNKVHYWNPADGKKSGEIAGFGGGVQSLLLAGEHLVATSNDGTARRFKVADRSVVNNLTEHPDWVLSAAVDSGQRLLAAGCIDGTIRVWSLEDGSQVQQFRAAPGLDVDAGQAAAAAP